MFGWVRFYVAPTLWRLYGEFPALLVEGDLRCPSVHYFRTRVHLSRATYFVSELDISLTWKNPKPLVGFETTAVRSKWFYVIDSYHLATDAPESSNISFGSSSPEDGGIFYVIFTILFVPPKIDLLDNMYQKPIWSD